MKKKKHQAKPRAPAPRGPPIPPRRTALADVQADSEDLDATAEYRRKDETELVIPAPSITTELSATGTIAVRRAYFLAWLVPDPSNKRGSLLEIERFHLRLVNESCFDINVVVQQPHGHESVPSSVSSWVLLENRTVRSGGAVVLTIRPVDNSQVVPLRQEFNGADCVVLAAVSAARQGQTQAGGTTVAKTEVGIRATVQAVYKASGNVLDTGSFFAVRTYASDTPMFHVDSQPAVPIRVADVSLDGKQVTKLKFAKTANGYIGPAFFRDAHAVDGNSTVLDRGKAYLMPVTVMGQTAARKPIMGAYIRYSPTLEEWVVSSSFDVVGAIQAGDGSYIPEVTALPELSGDAILIPVGSNTFSRLPVRNRTMPRPLQLAPRRGGAPALTGTVREDVLAAVSFVVSVIKIAAAVAGAAGLLNVLDGDVEEVGADDGRPDGGFEKVM